MDLDVSKEWVHVHDLVRLLSHSDGSRFGRSVLSNSPGLVGGLTVCTTIQVAGLYFRLRAQAPVVLLGDSGTRQDETLCTLLCMMLGGSLKIANFQGETIDLITECFADRTLLLVRSASDRDHARSIEQALAQTSQLGQMWTVGSVHFKTKESLLYFQWMSSRSLREAVVFY